MSAIPHDLLIAVRVLVMLVFVQAAIGKMRHWLTFQGVVANYRLLPPFIVPMVAYALPPIELLLGAGLLVAHLSSGCAVAGAALLSIFALAMAINLWRGRDHIDCGCFQSALEQKLRWILVVRNVVMAVALLVSLELQTGVVDGWILLNGFLGGIASFIAVTSLNSLWAIVPAFGRSARTRVQFKG